MSAAPFTGAVLAGGAGRRLGGVDKARLAGPDGRPLLRRALDALRAAGADPDHLLVAAGADPDRLADLDLGPGVMLLADTPPDRGPLGGLAAVLAASPHPWVVVVATDAPHLDPTLLAGLAAAADTPPARVPSVDGTLQPLHAAWHTSALPAIDSALAEDRLALHALARTLGAETPTYPPSDSFQSVNTPDDLDWT